MPLRLLVDAERVVLFVVSLVLLAIGVAALVIAMFTLIESNVPWTERLIVAIEDLLLILIIMEIFVTVVTHLRGGRLQLDFFIIIGVIAVVRHILSIVVRLTIPNSPAETQRQLIDLGVDAGVVFVLVAALAIARWSARRSDVA